MIGSLRSGASMASPEVRRPGVVERRFLPLANRSLAMVLDRRTGFVLAYIVLWSAQAMVIKMSLVKNDSDEDVYPFEVMTATIATESFKLWMAFGIYMIGDQERSTSAKLERIRHALPAGLYLIIPAALYSVYNGLMFMNLRLLEPGTYRILINGRVIFSGLLLQLFFQMRLTRTQWVAIALLLMACIVEQTGSFRIEGGVFAVVLMSLQGMCSSLAGVYFQWILQRSHSAEMGLWMKNMFLYFWSIICNLIVMALFRPDLLAPSTFVATINGTFIVIVVLAGFGGLFTSLLLRHLDVLIKEYANFAEIMVVALAQRFLLGIPLRPTLMLAVAMMSYSLFMYQTGFEPVSAHEHRKSNKDDSIDE